VEVVCWRRRRQGSRNVKFLMAYFTEILRFFGSSFAWWDTPNPFEDSTVKTQPTAP
jgi:hypothetical protein